MNNNVNYYNINCLDYISSSLKLNMNSMVDRFSLYGGLKDDDKVLDAGCGSGRDSLYMKYDKGFLVSAFDASQEMVNAIKLSTNIDVKVMDFLSFDEFEKYDGIWCCASLLHVHFDDFEEALSRLIKSLKSGGILYFSIKKSEKDVKEWMIGERSFYHPGKDKIAEIANRFGLSEVDFFCTGKIGDVSQTFENYFFKKN